MTAAIPTIGTCLQYIERYDMLENIRAHSLLVARVANTLVDSLKRTKNLNQKITPPEAVFAGALLHDIAKTMCLHNECHHAKEGQIICEELGHPEIGEIVAEHVVLKNFQKELYRKGIFPPKELVYYSDKRVRHDSVVSLADRLEYILERYGNGDSTKEHYIRLNFNRTIEFENYLFSFLDFTPEDLGVKILPFDFTDL
jgi:uncharacterized protein